MIGCPWRVALWMKSVDVGVGFASAKSVDWVALEGFDFRCLLGGICEGPGDCRGESCGDRRELMSILPPAGHQIQDVRSGRRYAITETTSNLAAPCEAPDWRKTVGSSKYFSNRSLSALRDSCGDGRCAMLISSLLQDHWWPNDYLTRSSVSEASGRTAKVGSASSEQARHSRAEDTLTSCLLREGLHV